MLRRRVAVLAAAAMMVLCMLVASAPVFAQGEGGCDPQPGQTEKARAWHDSPPAGKPGQLHRDATANEHDTHKGATGFGDRVGECA